MRQVRWAIFFQCFLFLQPIHAQTDSSSHPFFPVVLDDTKLGLHDAGVFFSSPSGFTQTEWVITGGIVAGTAAVFLIDDEVRSLVQRNQTSFLNDLSEGSRIYGENYFGVGISAGVYGIGLLTKNPNLRTTGLMVFESVAFSAVITQVVKVVAGRSRPYTNNGNHDFNFFQFEESSISLPSGHATAAFAVSSVLANRLNNKYASVGLFSMATLTALSRVYSDVHWTSDILLGSIIGIVTGNAVSQLHDEESNGMGVRVQPMLNGLRVEIIW